MITQHIEELPEASKLEVLDFVQFLEAKTVPASSQNTDENWSLFSIASVMSGMEDESSTYTVDDVKDWKGMYLYAN